MAYKPTTIELGKSPDGYTNDYASIVEEMSDAGVVCIVDDIRVKNSLVRALMRRREKVTGDQKFGHFTLKLEPKVVEKDGQKKEVDRWAIAIRDGEEDDQNPLPVIFPTDWMAANEKTTYGKWKKAAELLHRHREIPCNDHTEARKISVAYRHYYPNSDARILRRKNTEDSEDFEDTDDSEDSEDSELVGLYLSKKNPSRKRAKTKSKKK